MSKSIVCAIGRKERTKKIYEACLFMHRYDIYENEKWTFIYEAP